MVLVRDGRADRKTARSRPILSLRTDRSGPVKNALLAGGEHKSNSETQPQKQDFEAWLWNERNAWDIRRRSLPQDAEDWIAGGGFAGRGKLTRADADAMLSRAFTALNRNERVKEPNALARYREGDRK